MKFLHLGKNCEPGIIISQILGFKEKLPFQLMSSNLRAINQIIEDDFRLIVDKKYLLNSFRKKINIFKSDLERYHHNDYIYHSKYDVGFNHDFKVENNEILNYDFIVESWKDKINNFIQIIQSSDYKIFIHFCNEEVDIVELKKFIQLMEKKYNMDQNFSILVYSGKDNSKYNDEHVTSYQLKYFDFVNWWKPENMKKIIVHQEIYDYFYHFLMELNHEDFTPIKFEETTFYKSFEK